MKNNKSESILHDWVLELPFMQQALLLTAMRGPDGCPKYSFAKSIVRYLRGVVLKPAGQIVANEDDFMWIDYKYFLSHSKDFFSDTDMYPMHFLMHLIHAAEVVGYNHPDTIISNKWTIFYNEACRCFHMNPETKEQLNERLNK